MARPGQRKPPVGERLSDFVAIGVLTRTFPPDLVDRVIDETGKREQRVRLLPARMTVYFVLALCLFAHESYTEVAALLVKGLVWARIWSRPWTDPSDTALVNARRLGSEPLEAGVPTGRRTCGGPGHPRSLVPGLASRRVRRHHPRRS